MRTAGANQVHSFRKSALASAVALALTASLAQAQPVNGEIRALKSTIESLRKQVEELKQANPRPASSSLDQARVDELSKQVQELRGLLADQLAAKEAAAAMAAAGGQESQEAIDARTPASQADIVGLRADIESYKYDQSRLQERNIPSVTRNTRIGGGITL